MVSDRPCASPWASLKRQSLTRCPSLISRPGQAKSATGGCAPTPQPHTARAGCRGEYPSAGSSMRASTLLWMRAPSGMVRGAGLHSRQKPALETWRRPAGSGESLARQSGLRRRPRASALFEHPFQCDVGEAGVGVPAADIGVDAGEPDLLDRLVIGPGVLAPHVGRELLALFVNGDRVDSRTSRRGSALNRRTSGPRTSPSRRPCPTRR